MYTQMQENLTILIWFHNMNLKNNFDKGYLQNHKISPNFILHFGGKKKIQVKLDRWNLPEIFRKNFTINGASLTILFTPSIFILPPRPPPHPSQLHKSHYTKLLMHMFIMCMYFTYVFGHHFLACRYEQTRFFN